jgi:hypothetical protein
LTVTPSAMTSGAIVLSHACERAPAGVRVGELGDRLADSRRHDRDDPAPAALAHARQQSGRQLDRREGEKLERAAPLGRVRLRRLGRDRAAGVEDRDVDRAETRAPPARPPWPAWRDRRRRRRWSRPRPNGAAGSPRRPLQRLAAARPEGQLAALGRQTLGRRPPEPGRGSTRPARFDPAAPDPSRSSSSFAAHGAMVAPAAAATLRYGVNERTGGTTERAVEAAYVRAGRPGGDRRGRVAVRHRPRRRLPARHPIAGRGGSGAVSRCRPGRRRGRGDRRDRPDRRPAQGDRLALDISRTSSAWRWAATSTDRRAAATARRCRVRSRRGRHFRVRTRPSPTTTRPSGCSGAVR